MGYASKNQGLFRPRNPEKYSGNVNNITFRSSWELQMNRFLDNNPNILKWSSEPFAIPYVKPTDGKIHKYYPDYWVEYRNKSGVICHEIIEVKPKTQTQQPRSRGKSKKTQLTETITWAVNVAKWKACQQFCDKYGIRFRLVTEDELFK